VSDSPTDDAVSVSYDADAGTYRARFDDDAIAPSMAVVETVASVRGTAPMELDPLIETIEPMAVDRLAHGPDGRSLEFRYLDHTVTVHARGVVEVRPASDGD
jgi:hypothetical protein